MPDYGTLTDWALAQAQARARAAANGRGRGAAPGDEMYEARVDIDLVGEASSSQTWWNHSTLQCHMHLETWQDAARMMSPRRFTSRQGMDDAIHVMSRAAFPMPSTWAGRLLQSC